MLPALWCHLSELDPITKLRVLGRYNTFDKQFLLPDPEPNVESRTYLERQGRLDVTPTRADVSSV